MKRKGNIQKQGIPPINDTWAIRGIQSETRTAATMAARRSGQSIGEWCDRALREAATDLLKAGAIGPTIEESLMKLAESMAQQAEATSRQMEATQQQNAAMAARLEAVEQRERPAAMNGGGNLFGRLYGLLWRPLPQPESTNR